MELTTFKRIEELKKEGVPSVCSIWISEEIDEDNSRTYDVNVWNERENEREESLEEGYFPTYEKAKEALIRIIESNPDISFVWLSDLDYLGLTNDISKEIK